MPTIRHRIVQAKCSSLAGQLSLELSVVQLVYLRHPFTQSASVVYAFFLHFIATSTEQWETRRGRTTNLKI